MTKKKSSSKKIKKPMLIGLGILSLLFVVIVLPVIYFFVFYHEVDDSLTLYPQLTALSQDKSNWQRREIPELDISIAFPKEFSFSTRTSDSGGDLGQEYHFKINIGHPIGVSIRKSMETESESNWMSTCKRQLPGTSQDPELHWVYCGQNSYLVQTSDQTLLVGVGSYYNHPDHPEETRERIRALVEEIIGTIAIHSW